jgi:putative membrane protein
MAFVLRLFISAFSLGLASRLIPGFYIADWSTLFLAAILLGVVNAVVKPVLVLLTLPISILTLGLFVLVVNAAMIGLVAWLLPGMVVHGLFAGIGAAVITGVASWIGHLAVGDAKRIEGY